MSTIIVDGIERPLHNSKGQLIHVSEAGIVNFWRWFGDSQAIDADGRPQVFYHGSIVWEHDGRQLGDIHIFNRKASTEIVRRAPSADEVGIWFSDSPGMNGAEMYASNSGVIYPVYLRVLDAKRTTFIAMTRTAYRLGHGEPPAQGMAKPTDLEPYRTWLKDAGYDALRLIHDERSSPTSTGTISTEFKHQNVYVVLEPNQIKSAIGNSGHFSPDSPCLSDDLSRRKTRRQTSGNNLEMSP